MTTADWLHILFGLLIGFMVGVVLCEYDHKHWRNKPKLAKGGE